MLSTSENLALSVFGRGLRLPALCAYTVGMSGIQYTVRSVPSKLDAELRREAHATGKTLNALVVETLEHAKLPSSQAVYDDLDWFVGTGPCESELDDAQAWLDALPVEPA
jgi:hypothetical protein